MTKTKTESARTKNSFTPGPWKVAGAFTVKQDIPFAGEVVAVAQRMETDRRRPSEDDGNDYRDDESRANARLIAAAPDLLFVAKLYQGLEDQEAWAHEWCEDRALDSERPRDVLTRVRRAAIDKAEEDRV